MATKQATKSSSATRKADKVWTDEERAAMQESARERKAASRRGKGDDRAEGEQRPARRASPRCPPTTAPWPSGSTRSSRARRPALAEDVLRHAGLRQARTARSSASSKPKSKFKVRYSTFGFQPDASLDDGAMWPIAFAVTELTPGAEAQIAELVKKAAG